MSVSKPPAPVRKSTHEVSRRALRVFLDQPWGGEVGFVPVAVRLGPVAAELATF